MVLNFSMILVLRLSFNVPRFWLVSCGARCVCGRVRVMAHCGEPLSALSQMTATSIAVEVAQEEV